MRMGLWEKYLMLFNRASSPKSSDFTRATIYTFEKWCKACGAGLSRPQRHETKERKRLYKHGFCRVICFENGPRSSAPMSAGSTDRLPPKKMALDDMIMVSKALDEQEAKMPPFVRLLKEVDVTYYMLSEKLSAMELFTGERWQPSKFYFWLGRALR